MTNEKEKTTPHKGVSRRQFIAGTVGGLVVGAAAGAVSGSLGFPKTVTVTAQPWLPSKWDYTADIVVLGTGLAGLATAISGADAGAKVLVLEKMDQAHEGGTSKVSGNMFWAPDDVASGEAYIKAMAKGSVSDDVVAFLAQGLIDNLAYIKSLGGQYGYMGPAEWPVYPGASGAKMYAMLVNGTVTLGGGHLYQLYMDNVTKRASNITIMYSTPATGLIQNDDTKEILGVTALTGGTVSSIGLPTGGSTINIKANKGVVLACGGFEFNFDMEHQYLIAWPIYGNGCPGNTGDGIHMAEEAGADLWHTNCTSGGGPNGLVVPDFPYPIAEVSITPPANGYIWVDKHGNRYCSEVSVEFGSFGRHGWGIMEYTLQFNGTEGDFLRIPTWLIFDETTRLAGPFFPNNNMGWFNWYSGYTWSKDNSAEIAKGWIVKGSSIADLASKIAADPDNVNPMGQPTMDPTGAGLQATISRWNSFVAAKADADFGRAANTLATVQTPPFYAMKLWPLMVNTQGGPRRNTSAQVLDANGNPIPRLYSAGECGSMWGWTYDAGGNLMECMLTGRTAGKNIAALTNWT